MRLFGALFAASLMAFAHANVDSTPEEFFDPDAPREHPDAKYTKCETITADTVGFGNATHGRMNDRFGFRIVTNDEYFAISAPFREDCTGLVYMYEMSTQGDIEITQTIESPEADNFHLFGEAMAMDGKYMVITSRRVNQNAGSAYVYKESGGTWSNIDIIDVTLLAENDGNAKGDTFGWAVAIKNGLIAISSAGDDTQANQNGAVYMFKINDSEDGVDFITKIFSPTDLKKESFGQALALNEEGTLVVGAYRFPSDPITGYNVTDNNNPDQTGKVHVFTTSDFTSWTSISGSGIGLANALPGDRFGFSVDIAGDVIAVGADGYPGGYRVGRVFIYEISGSSVTLEQEIVPDDCQEGDGFGTTLRFGSTSKLIVGAHFADTGKDEDEFVYHGGSAWLYEYSQLGEWELHGRATPEQQQERDFIGHSVEFFMGTEYFIMGATGDDLGNVAEKSHAGAAYICKYEPNDPPGRPCNDNFSDKLDILWVIDSSGSIDEPQYELVQKFLRRISRNFTLSDDNTRFGLVPFSTGVDTGNVVKFEDGPASNGAQWRQWINSLTRTPAFTDIPEALIYSYQQVFTSDVKREGSENVVVVLTDGVPNRRTGCFANFNTNDIELCTQLAAAELVDVNGDDAYFIYIPLDLSGDTNEDLFEDVEDERFPTSIQNLLQILNNLVNNIVCEEPTLG